MIVCEKENNSEKKWKRNFSKKKESTEQTQKFSFVLP